MTFRIHTSVDEKAVTFSLSGQLDDEGIAELRRLFDDRKGGPQLILDLNETGLVGRNAIRSLKVFERRGIQLVNIPMYVRDWMSKETEQRRTNGTTLKKQK